MVTKKDFGCSYEGSGIELELDQVLDFGKSRIGYRMWEVAKYFLSSSKTFLEQFHTGVRILHNPESLSRAHSTHSVTFRVLYIQFILRDPPI